MYIHQEKLQTVLLREAHLNLQSNALKSRQDQTRLWFYLYYLTNTFIFFFLRKFNRFISGEIISVVVLIEKLMEIYGVEDVLSDDRILTLIIFNKLAHVISTWFAPCFVWILWYSLLKMTCFFEVGHHLFDQHWIFI